MVYVGVTFCPWLIMSAYFESLCVFCCYWMCCTVVYTSSYYNFGVCGIGTARKQKGCNASISLLTELSVEEFTLLLLVC